MQIKQAIQNIIGTTAYLGTQWVMLISVVHMMDYDYAGMFSLAITITSLFFIISSFGLRQYQVTDINGEFTNIQYLIARTVSITIGFFLCMVFLFFSSYESLQRKVVLLYMLYKSLESASELIYGYYQNDGRFDFICISLVLKGLLQLGAFLLGLWYCVDLCVALIFMCIAILGVLVLYDLPRIKRKIIPIKPMCRPDYKHLLRLLYKCSPMVVVLVTTPLLQAIPRIYFEAKFSSELFGVFSSVAAPTVIFTVLVSSALIPFLPKFTEYYETNDYKRLARLIYGSIGITIGFGFFSLMALLLLGEWALVVLYGEDIRPWFEIIYSITISIILTSVLSCFVSLFIAVRKTAMLAVILLAGCLICYITTPSLITRFEMDGISYAMITGQVASILALTVLAMGILSKVRSKTMC